MYSFTPLLLLLWVTTLVIPRDYENRIYCIVYRRVIQQLGPRFEHCYWVSESRKKYISNNNNKKRHKEDPINIIERVYRQIRRRKSYEQTIISPLIHDDNTLYLPDIVVNISEDQPVNHESVKQSLGVLYPEFNQQWDLINQEQRENDLNIIAVWSQGDRNECSMFTSPNFEPGVGSSKERQFYHFLKHVLYDYSSKCFPNSSIYTKHERNYKVLSRFHDCYKSKPLLADKANRRNLYDHHQTVHKLSLPSQQRRKKLGDTDLNQLKWSVNGSK
ncbi:hypothetical protein BDC45DRAFT_532330 [Circinella umbellata]|nr:hypothetical protein BDC45DRAFT_532327 [Circinella umbellata]KAI7858045.1 hypothetical protein BDC45DRAFT_532330 [Circinella umbellata]